MVDYVEKLLHLKAEESAYTQTSGFPLYLKNSYIFNVLKVADIECLVAKPKDNINLSILRKHHKQLKSLTGMECVFCFEVLGAYTRQKMTAEGIPFIIEYKQIYMPFLGIAIGRDDRQLNEIGGISYLTQKLLLTAVYQQWTKVFLYEAARIMHVSKMSVSRCFDELDAVGLPLIVREGKGRCFIWRGSKRQLWDLVLPDLKDPVNKFFLLAESISNEQLLLSGISALCHYSSLADNTYQTYAVTKAMAREMCLQKQPLVPAGEVPAMAIQVLHYVIPFHGGQAIDPLTAVLSITQAEISDPRTETAVEEVLEEYLTDERH